MVITWSDISMRLGEWAVSANAFTLVVSGTLVTFLKNWITSPESAEKEVKTLKASLNVKIVESYKRLFNWHGRNVLECAENEFLPALADPVQSHVNELLRCISLIKRLERIYHRVQAIHEWLFVLAAYSLLSFVFSLLFPSIRPWTGILTCVVLISEIALARFSHSCKAKLEEASEAI